ncbi:TonB-dependent receptor [Pseudomonas alliivorans]|nr:TonB-dependent receptor [Pseudomonas alliivorans]MEE4711752.1 TonB-dependent receptor [Pseudomonas alliivorans]MEE4717147.1 TonB-dependent receptor [Pseudomonas alliivorans]MEE4722167.1 TonB-dependent receptor [Pseudomonas alliivorans]MEE4726913.1 TonB-dependent receptor [Pseudomonas alliivorans]
MLTRTRAFYPLVSGAVLLTLIPPAVAQEPSGKSDAPAAESVTVTGYVKQNREEIRAKRNTSQVADFISSDELGQQPDLNVADSLRRLPDVTTEFDEDEGRFVSIRGLPSRFTTTTFDGAMIPDGWFALGRQTDLEAIPGVALKRVGVYKSLTPDLQPAIAGIVDLQPISAFDYSGFQAVTDSKVGHYSNMSVPGGPSSPSAIIDGRVNDRFGEDKQFGYMLAGSFSDRSRDQEKDIRTINYSAAGTPSVDRRDQARYTNRLDRWSLLGRLEYKPSENLYSSLLGAHYSYDSDEYRYLNILEGRSPRNITDVSGSYAQGRNRYRVDYFPETTATDLAIWDVDFKPADQQRLTSKLYAARSTYERKDDGQFEFRSAYGSSFGYQYDLTSQDADNRDMSTITPANPSAANTPANYQLFTIQPEKLERQQTIKEWQGTYGFNTDPQDRGPGVRVGTSWRRMEVTQDIDQQSFLPTSAASLPASSFSNAGDYYKATNRFFADNPGLFRLDQANSTLLSTQNDLSYQEDIAAGFGLLRYRGERFEILGGARYEHTRFDSSAFQNNSGTLNPSSNSGSYDNVLPSLSAFYDLTASVRLRAGFSQSLGRPNPEYVVPLNSVSQVDGAVSINRGNPSLKPITSNNYDLAADYYFGQGALLSMALFQKDLKNEIFVGSSSSTDSTGVQTTISQPLNTSTAQVRGVSVNLIKDRLAFLPAPFDGLGFKLNSTWLDGSMNVPMADGSTRRASQLVDAPKQQYNATLMYAIGDIKSQISYAVVGDRRTSLSVQNPRQDKFEERYGQLDAQVSYALNANLTLYTEGRNLTDQKRLIRDADNNLLERNSFGQSLWVGMKVRL